MSAKLEYGKLFRLITGENSPKSIADIKKKLFARQAISKPSEAVPAG